LRSFGSHGAGAGQFNCPWGIAFDGAGHIIVPDCINHRVQIIRYSDGTHVRTIGSQGSDNGQFFSPKGIAVDGEGNVAVFDNGNARVQVFRLSDGAYAQLRQRQRAVRRRQ
jgi:DNA-binding beta-propeller fold protein YncE